MAYGNNPTTTTQGALPTNQFPASSVYPPNIGGSNPTHDFKASGGGPIRIDDDGNPYSEPLVYINDGSDVTQGAKADTAATSGTGSWSAIALLKGILTKLLGTIAVSGTFWQATQPVSATSLPLPTGAALEAGHLATIDTSTAASKTDLDTIVTNTNKIPASPAQEGGNLASILTQVTNHAVTQGAGAAAGTSWRIGGDFTEIASLSAGSLSADLVPAMDVSAYKWLSLHINTNAYSGVISFQCSNDNVNYVALNLSQSGSTLYPTSTNSAGAISSGPVFFRYLRIRMTSYTSGAAQGTLELYTSASMTSVIGIGGNGPSVAQSGVWSMGAATTNGTSDFHLISAATTNAATIKASAGQVYGYEIYNTNAAVRYVKLFNKTTNPVLGTDIPFRTIAVPPSGRAFLHSITGISMGTGISIATTTGIADLDVAAVGAADLSIDIDFK
jgi:hypothetical protein